MEQTMELSRTSNRVRVYLANHEKAFFRDFSQAYSPRASWRTSYPLSELFGVEGIQSPSTQSPQTISVTNSVIYTFSNTNTITNFLKSGVVGLLPAFGRSARKELLFSPQNPTFSTRKENRPEFNRDSLLFSESLFFLFLSLFLVYSLVYSRQHNEYPNRASNSNSIRNHHPTQRILAYRLSTFKYLTRSTHKMALPQDHQRGSILLRRGCE